MKKLVALMLIAAMLASFAACGSKNAEPATQAQPAQNETVAPAETASSADAAQNTDINPTGEKKILTIYFSSANTSGVDVVSSATPKFGEYASTEQLAVYIHHTVGGDLAKITPADDYPTDYNGTADAAKTERDHDERLAFSPLDVNPEDYDVIFVGYPIWWYPLPMIMYTFFDTYDFSGKTIVPFNTHAGSGNGGTYKTIAEFEPDATVLEGLPVSGGRADKAENDVNDWLAGLEF